MTTPLRLLIVEDSEDDALLLVRELRRAGFALEHRRVDTAEAMAAALDDATWDLVIGDYSMPHFSGTDALALVRARAGDTPFIFVSGTIGEDKAVEAMRAGANDYVLKDNLRRLVPAIERELRDAAARRERRRAEEALRASEARFRRLVDSNLIGIVFWHRSGLITDANDAFLRMLGYSRDDLEAGRLNYRTLTPPEHQPATARAVDDVTVGGVAGPFEKEYLHADGHRVPVLVGPAAFEDDPERGITFVLDLTESRRAQQALMDEAEMRRSILEATPLAVIVLDVQGRVVLWNRAAEQTFGWTADEVLGRPNPVLPPGGRSEADAIVRETLAGQLVVGQDVRRQRADGRWVDVRVSTAPIRDATGTPRGVVGILEDITDALRMEEQLRQAQRMEAVGRLAGGVAHDFNNILTVIMGEVQLALLDQGNVEVSSLEEIGKAAERASVLTRQLLAFSRQQIIEPKVIDVDHLLDGLGSMMHRLIGEDVDLRLELAADPATVLADAGQVEQVVLNLIVNARDAMPDGGRLTIQTGTVQLDAPTAGAFVEIAVRDTGTGMSDAVKEHLFEALFTTKGSGQGTGLGLATSHDIVTHFDGHITVESEVGTGTTMRVLLPVTSGRTDEEHGPRGEIPRGTETILFVEDDDAVRHAAVRILTMLGYAVLEAPNAERALQALARRDRPVDLLLTDLVLPGMNGRELADHAGAANPSLKILFASGYTDDVVMRHRVLAHGAAWVQKPFTVAELARKVRDVLDGAARDSGPAPRPPTDG
ncbi:MAG TPA: PAS domain S-box protein [Gemmatimonadales bacterium]|nr:PAS domain S-box protein [Gemmatimonadales bacterium]